MNWSQWYCSSFHLLWILKFSTHLTHDDVIKWKHFLSYWPFVRGIHRWPMNSPHKGQWRGAMIFCFDLRLNKRLSKQSRRRWFETPSHPLWHHCNGTWMGFLDILLNPRWRHDTETHFASLALCEGFQRSPVDPFSKDHWCGAVAFYLCFWTSCRTNSKSCQEI